MKKVLFVAPTISSGGAERVMANIASELYKYNVDVSIIVFERKEKEYEVDKNVKIFSVIDNIKTSNKILKRIEKFNVFYRYYKSISPDIVIPFLSQASEYAFICSKLTGSKFVSTIRNNPKIWPNSLRLRINNYLMCVFADACFFQNAEQRDMFPMFVRKKSVIIPNPINPTAFDISERFLYKDKPLRKFVSVGRLEKQKNFDLIISAVNILRQSYPDICVDIWGSGMDYEELKGRIEFLNLERNVLLRGHTGNVFDELLNYDAFLLSSDYEGMPNALMEAMAIGLPCISTDCPTGPKDLINSGINGLLVPVNDEVAFANAMCYFMENNDKATLMGKQAHIDAKEKYSIDKVCEIIINSIIYSR